MTDLRGKGSPQWAVSLLTDAARYATDEAGGHLPEQARYAHAAHVLVEGCRELYALAREDRLYDLWAVLEQLEVGALRGALAQLAMELAAAGWAPRGD